MTGAARHPVDAEGPVHVEGENGGAYRLTSTLGRGGQGTVWEARGGLHAVKILHGTRDPKVAERLRHRLAALRRLPVDDLSIAIPLEALRAPRVGYVMELVTGMKPLLGLLKAQPGRSPRDWYFESGGLSLRLGVLCSLAETLARLHGRGLVFGDLSPQNVFAAGTGRTHAWLIDADNIRVCDDPGGSTVYTPHYAAPETTRGAPASFSTDAHSLAVLVFQTLTLIHPLLGDEVCDGPPEGEDEALAGGLPWVDDVGDHRNRASYGIERACALTPRLQALAAAAFTQGRLEPSLRPSAAAWAGALRDASFLVLRCGACGAGFYAFESRCPWCGAKRPAHFAGYLTRVDTEASRQVNEASGAGPSFVLQEGETVVLDANGALHHSGEDRLPLVLRLKADRNALRAESLDGQPITLLDAGIGPQTTVGARGVVLRSDAAPFAGARLVLPPIASVSAVVACTQVPG